MLDECAGTSMAAWNDIYYSEARKTNYKTLKDFGLTTFYKIMT